MTTHLLDFLSDLPLRPSNMKSPNSIWEAREMPKIKMDPIDATQQRQLQQVSEALHSDILTDGVNHFMLMGGFVAHLVGPAGVAATVSTSRKPMNRFSLRSECQHDADQLRSLLVAAAGGSSITIIDDQNGFPDKDIEIQTPLAQNELLDLIRSISDGHVMLRTLSLVPFLPMEGALESGEKMQQTVKSDDLNENSLAKLLGEELDKLRSGTPSHKVWKPTWALDFFQSGRDQLDFWPLYEYSGVNDAGIPVRLTLCHLQPTPKVCIVSSVQDVNGVGSRSMYLAQCDDSDLVQAARRMLYVIKKSNQIGMPRDGVFEDQSESRAIQMKGEVERTVDRSLASGRKAKKTNGPSM